MFAQQREVRADQGEEDGRQQPDVDPKGPAQGDRSYRVAAAPQGAEKGADERRVGGNIGYDHGGPVRRLVPGEEGARDGHAQHQHEQTDAADPVELARSLVGTGKEGTDHVKADHEQQDVRRPEVNSTDNGAEGIVRLQVVKALPGLGHRGDEQQGEEDAGDQLKEDQHQRGTPQRVEPGAADRHRLVESLAQQAANRGTFVEPVVGGAEPAAHSDFLGEAVLDEERRAVDAMDILGQRLRWRAANVYAVDVVQPAVTRAEELVERGFPAHRALHVRAHVGEDLRVIPALDDVDGQVLLGRRPDVLREGDLELGRLAVPHARDVADFSPDGLLLTEERRNQEPDDWNAEQHGDDGARNLGAQKAELAAAQPPWVTMRHSE